MLRFKNVAFSGLSRQLIFLAITSVGFEHDMQSSAAHGGRAARFLAAALL